MTVTEFHPGKDSPITKLDEAINAHMDWTRRVIRCALLQESPGKDVLEPAAHTLCRFGQWFLSNSDFLEKIDPENTRRLETVHRLMHDAIREICTDILSGQPGKEPHVDAFERAQSELVLLLSHLKTALVADAVQHDPLTGLPLRYGLENEFIHFRKNCRRNNTLFYVAMIDLDHFKRINDNYGHKVGDLALCHVAAILKRSVRDNEPLHRYGGEEFLLMLQSRDTQGVEMTAQRLIDTVRTTPVPVLQGVPIALTVTVGFTCVGDDDDLAGVVERADRALFEGKRAGRDRFVIAGT